MKLLRSDATLSEVTFGPHDLPGTLAVPRRTHGVVVFAHGSGSSRQSVRNQKVAEQLRYSGCATFLFDLLTDPESQNRSLVFDIELLANRLSSAMNWIRHQTELQGLPIGLFGASTGAAAALVVAAEHQAEVAAVVSRGGRPDLADLYLDAVRAPTLFLVGALDEEVLQFNRGAIERMHCERQLEIIPGATHLFPEEGALEIVSRLAADWFAQHFSGVE